ncbi:MAG: DUF4176 domain-containing protein [Defluviitaleaceae bacterium]|nr:DUF4176 domain-containing protein [Defluviitaleaceae bacterium]
MEIAELLPIGSIVLLKEGIKRLMIFGIKQTDVLEDGTANDYDYVGVLYPEGNVGKEYQFLFNHENIAEVIFRGFEDTERDDFISTLTTYYKQQLEQGGQPTPPTAEETDNG